MLKLRLPNLDGLSADASKEYKKDGDGFILDTDVAFEDVSGLKNALVQEKDHRKQATTKVTELETQLAEATGKLTGSTADLEKSWQQKLEKAQKDSRGRIDALTSNLQKILVDGVAGTLAAEISTVPHLLAPAIAKRLQAVEGDDGSFITRVLTADGKASALSVNELKSEILADKQFAPILTGSRASGGGAQQSQHGLPPSGKKFTDMTETEKVALFKSNRSEFDKLKTEFEANPKAPEAK
jgi:hypothetical protein